MTKKKEDQKFAWGKGDVKVTLPQDLPKPDRGEKEYLEGSNEKTEK